MSKAMPPSKSGASTHTKGVPWSPRMNNFGMERKGLPTVPLASPIERAESIKFMKAKLAATFDSEHRSALHASVVEMEENLFRSAASRPGYVRSIALAIKEVQKKFLHLNNQKAQAEIRRELLAPWRTIPKQDVERMAIETDLMAAHAFGSHTGVIDEDMLLPNLDLEKEVHQYWESVEGPGKEGPGKVTGKGKHVQGLSTIKDNMMINWAEDSRGGKGGSAADEKKGS